jgi:hypothetical protein
VSRKQIGISRVGPSEPHRPFVPPLPAVIDAETTDGPANLVFAPAAAAVLAEELTRYLTLCARNHSG